MPLSIYPNNSELELIINNIQSEKGVLNIAIVRTEKSYQKAIKQDRTIIPYSALLIPPKKPTMSISISALKHGNYSILVFQDLNQNQIIDMGFFGPKEPYGFSNNAIGLFGPPTYQQTLVSLKKNKSMFKISLR